MATRFRACGGAWLHSHGAAPAAAAAVFTAPWIWIWLRNKAQHDMTVSAAAGAGGRVVTAPAGLCSKWLVASGVLEIQGHAPPPHSRKRQHRGGIDDMDDCLFVKARASCGMNNAARCDVALRVSK